MEKVLTLLSNLVVQIDRDASNDESDHSEFTFWFEAQERSTDEALGALNAKLSELSASLTDLRAHRQTTAAQVEDIRGQKTIQEEQLNQATTKRSDEKDAFVKEQLDFKNSIEACERAVDLLAAHYGDGSPRENTKPAWLSLAGVLSTITRAAKRHNKPVSVALSQQAQPDYFANANGASLYNEYEDSTGEALSIVDQVKQLKKTFEEDKTSAAEQEQGLSQAFTTLSKEKEKIILTLTSQLTELSSTVTAAEEQIAEETAAEQTAQVGLQNEQAYMNQIRTQAKDVNEAFATRKKDRAAEREALREAQTILSAPSDTALLQLCPQCARATALLRRAAQSLHSEVLSTAAAEAAAPGPLADVVTELEGLLQRIDETQAAEAQHAEWCTKELSAATAKKEQHTALGVEAQTSLQNAEVLLTEKQQALDEVKEDVGDLDTDWQQQEKLRSKQKGDLALSQQNALSAVAALEQAEQMLAAFYGVPAAAEAPEPPEALLQREVRAGGAVRAAQAPGANTDAYVKVGGRVLGALADLRRDFSAAADDAAKAEQQAATDFSAAKSHYDETRGNLVDSGTQLVQQLQTAEKDRATLRESMTAHQESVDSAVAYLAQLRRSCASLTANFATREEVRKSERAAVAEAIAVLKGESLPAPA